MAYSIDIIPSSYVSQVWGVAGELLDSCKNYGLGDITIDQMKVMLVRGEYQLMMFNTDIKPIAALIVSFFNYPNKRVMFVHAIGGKTTKEHVKQMFDWAKQNGATSVQGDARESVARLWHLKYGFETISYRVEKKL